MDWQRGEAGCLTWTHEGTRHGRKTEPPRLGGDPQTVGPLPGQLRRPRPDPLLRADDVHRTDGRRGVAARERRMIERDEWTSPKKRAKDVAVRHIRLAEYGQTWIDQRNVKPRTRIGYQA